MSSEKKPSSTALPTTENTIVDGVLRYPSTGIKALVVGAGVAGLMTALECWRKGIDVEVVEKVDQILIVGDIFAIGPSALTTLRYYPSLLKDYDEIAHDAIIHYAARDGNLTMPPMEFEWNREGVAPSSAYPLRAKALFSRPDFTLMLYRQCQRLGIPFTFGVAVDRYEEDTEKGNATAIAQDGRRFTADFVVAADGLGTKSHTITLGKPVKAFKTGFVAYRGMYSTERLKGVKVAEDVLKNLERPIFLFVTANMAHCVFTITKNQVSIGIAIEEDDETTTESWSATISNERALAALPEPDTWSPLIREIIGNAPDNSIVRWSLCFRDPQPRWASPGGHVIQLGDSCHSFLPTSGNGATQAMEDAASLPECLRLAGKSRVAIATKVHELLRYQRVSLIQHTGFVNMQDVHHEPDKNGTGIPPLLMGKWLWGHNPEIYATENFAKALDHLEKGTPFENTNLPPGHKWSDWTVEEELAKQRAGIITLNELKFNGDWTMV
ncbi:FAD/NAD(P)-binding domain-containing protein [Hypomontagnella monticulosa]|nr:FAD/NAD(P)-binding domain-containing protein [Hypomontagnella monticulosa]